MSATIAPPNRLAELPIEIFLEIVQDELLLVGADLNLPPVLEAMRPYPRHYEAALELYYRQKRTFHIVPYSKDPSGGLPEIYNSTFDQVRCIRFVYPHNPGHANDEFGFLCSSAHNSESKFKKIVVVFWRFYFERLLEGDIPGVNCLQLGYQGLHSSLEGEDHGGLKHFLGRLAEKEGLGLFDIPSVKDHVDVGNGKGAVWTWNLKTNTSASPNGNSAVVGS